MSSVSFWYQQGVAPGLPPIPYGSARLPQGNAKQIEVENAIGQVKAEKGKASVSKDLFWSKDVILFEGQGEGAKLEIPFDVDEDGDYEFYTQLAQASDYGIYTVLLDGKPAVAPVLEHEPGADVRPQTQFDGYAFETYVGMDFQIGWPRLSKGRHTVTFTCLGKNAASSGYNLGVDNLILARTGPSGWAKAAAVRAPVVPESVSGLASALDDPDPVTRGLAALELKNKGRAAKPALPALVAKLKDPDVIVRMTSANAIAAMGPEAASAVPALIAACRVESEVTHVLRACAAALGEIGPAASSALPALRDLVAQKPLVRRSAERAIEQIEGGATAVERQPGSAEAPPAHLPIEGEQGLNTATPRVDIA